jgi:hypothetical protein
MVAFDPIALARSCRTTRLHLPVESDPSAFAPNRYGNAGAKSINAIVSCWLIGEGARFEEALRRAVDWIERAEATNEVYGLDPSFSALERKRALAVGRWLLGGAIDRPLWRDACRLSAVRVAAMPPDAPAFIAAEHLLDCLLAGEPGRALSAPVPAEAASSADVAAALVLAKGEAAESVVAELYRRRAAYWLEEADFIAIAMWAMAAWFETGLAETPDAALLALYAFLEDVPVAPALADRGWTDAPGPVLLALPAGTALDRLDRAVTALGLVRDPDRTTPPAGTAFASWTGPPGDDGEIDYLAEDGVARLELRGRRAAMRGNVLMTLCGARRAPAPEEALADLLTPPPRAGDRDNALLRWRTLSAAVAAAGPANSELVRALVAAGLRDPDWRVRMTAVLAVGRLRLADLAEQAMAAKVPDAGTDGLGQEDRRALLALRHAARNLALGLPPGADLAGEPEVMAKRIAWQERLRALIADRAAEAGETGDDRAAALVDRLLGGADQ